jgi:hypothetical protein
MKINTFNHSRWRRFDFVELVPQKRNSVVIGAPDMGDNLMARIANPHHLSMRITKHQSLI